MDIQPATPPAHLHKREPLPRVLVNIAHITFVRIGVVGGVCVGVGFGGACVGAGGGGGGVVVIGSGDGALGGDVGEDRHGGVRRGGGDGEVRVDEDVVLSAVEEVVAVVVDRWGECAFEHLYSND